MPAPATTPPALTPADEVARLVAALAAPTAAPLPTTLPALMPRLSFDPALLLRAQPVKVVFFDVDGVMTDGGLFITEAGETIKRFHALDGHGIKLLQRVGITPAVVTGRDSAPLRKRLAALGVTHVRYGTEDKRPAAESILADLGLTWSQAAAMGDDWPDAPVLRRVALACAPRSAHTEVLALAHYVPDVPAGQGAVRAMCDLLLVATGQYERLWREQSA